MSDQRQFTWQALEREYQAAQDRGYTFLSCYGYVLNKTNLPTRTIVNRVDIDLSVKKAERLVRIFDQLSIQATFFVRLHAPEYNPFSFENFRILKLIRDHGYEIGLHCEVMDQSWIWNEAGSKCLERDITVLQTMLDIQIVGLASHGGLTGLNNLRFWDEHKPSDFGLVYEAYDRLDAFCLFHDALYISDSEYTQWKSYKNGVLQSGDRRSLSEHLDDDPPLVYLLVHPDTYFERHIYESE